MIRHLRRSCALAYAVLATGCLSSPGDPGYEPEPVTPGADAGVAFELRARDARGDAWPVDALPRRVRLELHGVASPDARPAIFLFDGPPDTALFADLERHPVLVAHQARAVAVAVHQEKDGPTSLVPEAPLSPGRRYALGVASWALDDRGVAIGEPRLLALRVADAEAGADVLETWPAAGTYGVPVAIPFLAVRFDDVVDGLDGVRVSTADGEPLSGTTRRTPCSDLALAPGECVAFEPDEPLPEQSALRIDLGTELVDRTGASIGPFGADFRTGTAHEAIEAPSLDPLDCALDEAPLEGACLLAFDAHVRVRARASGPARAVLSTLAGSSSAAAPRGDMAFEVTRLEPGASVPATLTLIGLDGVETVVAFVLETHVDLPRVFITEVRADPDGPEPDQEYVEIHNASDSTIDLAGYRITDDATRAGDVIEAPALLPAHGYALLVGAAFDPDGADDDPVPPGIPLFRLDASIAGGGLTNGGEPLFLRDASGRRLSAAPALAAPGPGVCLVRAVAEGRAGAASAFAPHGEGRCGPGRVDPVADL